MYGINPIASDKPAPITLKTNFPKNDPITGKPLNIQLSSFNFTGEIEMLSAYKREQKSEHGTYLSSWFDSGLRVTKTSAGYQLEYYRERIRKFHKGTYAGDKGGKHVMFIIGAKTINANEIIFTFPDTFTLSESGEQGTWSRIDSVDSNEIEKLEDDVRRIFYGLSSVVAYRLSSVSKSVSFSKTIKGEIDSKNKDNEVYGNFKRILGGWSGEYQTDALKTNVFTLRVGDRSLPLTVEVYPYRGGSKVVYSAPTITIDYKYMLYSDGKVDGSYAERIAQEKKLDTDIKNAVALIKKIIEN